MGLWVKKRLDVAKGGKTFTLKPKMYNQPILEFLPVWVRRHPRYLASVKLQDIVVIEKKKETKEEPQVELKEEPVDPPKEIVPTPSKRGRKKKSTTQSSSD